MLGGDGCFCIQRAMARGSASSWMRRVGLARSRSSISENLRLLEEIDADTYAEKATELRDKDARLRLEIEACSGGQDETADLAVKAFGLSQSLEAKWVTSDYAAKRRTLEIVCLNWRLVDVSLVPTMRKPFDLLAEGLVLNNSRGEKIRTSDLLVPNQAL